MRTALIVGVATVTLLAAGVAIAAAADPDTEVVLAPAASGTEPGVSSSSTGAAFDERLGDRFERRVERRVDRRARLQAFARDVAAELDLEPEEVRDAVTTVASQRLETAVEAGLVDEATAQQVRGALDSGDPSEVRQAIRALLHATLDDRAPVADAG
jgi:hypothetical protein